MATANDRFNIYAQLEHLQAKHVGTGHPDISKLCVPLPRLISSHAVSIPPLSAKIHLHTFHLK